MVNWVFGQSTYCAALTLVSRMLLALSSSFTNKFAFVISSKTLSSGCRAPMGKMFDWSLDATVGMWCRRSKKCWLQSESARGHVWLDGVHTPVLEKKGSLR